MRSLIVCVVAVVAGCSGGAEPTQGGSAGGSTAAIQEPAPAPAPIKAATGCKPREGLYLIHAVEQSGTCGPFNDDLVRMSSPLPSGSTGTGCVNSPVTSADDCTTTDETDCTDSSGTFSLLDKITWDTAGASGVGTQQFTSKAPTYCSSVYSVTYTRQ